MESKGVFFRWVGHPIPAPTGSGGHPHGGRLTHYGAMEMVEPEAADSIDGVFISVDDIVDLVPPDGGKKNGGTLGNESTNNTSRNQPSLAQVEALWEDTFTGIPYCRARWLLRAPELPGSLSRSLPENEVFLTPATDDVEATCILGLAKIGLSAGADSVPCAEPLLSTDCRAMDTRRALRPRAGRMGRGKGRKKPALTLRLARGYDPFSEDFEALPVDHLALSRLRQRAREEAAEAAAAEAAAAAAADLDSYTAQEPGGVGGKIQHKRGPRGRSGGGITFGSWVAHGRSSAERKSLSGARLVAFSVEACGQSGSCGSGSGGDTSGVSGGSSSSASVENPSDSSISDASDEISNISSSGESGGVCAGRGDSLSGDSDAEAEEGGAKRAVRCHPMTRRTRQSALSSTPDVQRRPRRLAMPPGQAPAEIGPSARSSKIRGVNLRKLRRLMKPASAAVKRKSLLLGVGGSMAREAQRDPESEGSPETAFPHRQATVGREHQADIPALLSHEERVAYREELDKGEMGGMQVWASTRDWKDEDLCRLDEYLRQARQSMGARRFMPGMPVAINIGNGGDRRRKRRMAWAVISDGSKPVPPDKISVSCAGKELLEVSKDAVQPFQVEEMALHAWMQMKNLDDHGSALSVLRAQVDDSDSIATWSNEQISALVEALERSFDQDRYLRSRGNERYRDEHTDLASLSTSVQGKTPSQVLSFYYRYMATADSLSYVLGSAEGPKRTREKRSIRPRTPPPSRPSPASSPSYTLGHRPSLRCPPRLAQPQRYLHPQHPQLQQQASDSDSDRDSGSSQPLGSAQDGPRRGTSRLLTKKMKAVAAPKGVKPQDQDPSSPVQLEQQQRQQQQQEAFCDGRSASPRDLEQRAAYGAMGREVLKRSLEEECIDDGARGRVRRNRESGTSRSCIPADAVIVEVSDDDEERKVASRHDGIETSRGHGREFVEEAGPGRGFGNFNERCGAAGSAIEDKTARGAAREVGYDGGCADDRLNKIRYEDPCNPRRDHDHRCVGPVYTDPRYGGPRYEDPRYENPRYADLGCEDPRHADPRYANPRQADSRYLNPQYLDRRESAFRFADHGYAARGFADRDGLRFKAGHRAYPTPTVMSSGQGNAQGGVPPCEGNWGSEPWRGRTPGGGGGRREPVGFCVGDGHGRVPPETRHWEERHRGAGYGSMEYYWRCCWQLVEWARRTGLEEDRVRYLEGLLEAHESRPMTCAMLVERAESALRDWPKLLDNFVRLFAQMDYLPAADPWHSRHPYGAARPRLLLPLSATINTKNFNADRAQGVSSRPRTEWGLRYPPDPRYPPGPGPGSGSGSGLGQFQEGYYHGDGDGDGTMERVSPISSVLGSRTLVGQGRHRLDPCHPSPRPPLARALPPAFALAADVRMLGVGVGTSMRDSGASAALLPPPPPLPHPLPHETTNHDNISDSPSSMAGAGCVSYPYDSGDPSGSGGAPAHLVGESVSPLTMVAGAKSTPGRDDFGGREGDTPSTFRSSRLGVVSTRQIRPVASARVAAPDAAAGTSKSQPLADARLKEAAIDVDAL